MKYFLFALTAYAYAQTQIERPHIGYIRDARGNWHSVDGTSGSFVVSPEAQVPEVYSPRIDKLIERRGDSLYILDANGATVDILPPSAVCAVLMEDGLVFSTRNELVLRNDGYPETRVPVNGVTGLRAMSRQYVQVSAPGLEYLLRVEPGREMLFLLPAPRAEARRR